MTLPMLLLRRFAKAQMMRLLLALHIFVFLPSTPLVPSVSAEAGQCFAETGRCIGERFRDTWVGQGGLPVFGFPTGVVQFERNADDGEWYLTQWFERNRLEWHTDQAAPYDVALGRLGVAVLEQQGRDWRTFPTATPDTPQYFEETGHAVAHAPFWQYWSSHGLEFDGQEGTSFAESLALWGMPLSEPQMETNASGDVILTQWFERARFEDHGAGGVRLGLLGTEAKSYAIPPVSKEDATRVKDTDYAASSQAFYVATNGSDDNPGTQAEPWRTLGEALKRAPAGATVVLRKGTYREGNLTLTGKRLTLQPYPHERVWIKGSATVKQWEQDGELWRKDDWKYQFDYDLPADHAAIDARYPLAGKGDMVFINGQPLRQVARKSDVRPGSFYINYDKDTIYIADNPRDKTVEVSKFAQALEIVDAPGTIVRGLGFAHYATRIQNGAVRGDSARLLFENNTFVWNAAAGLSVIGPDSVVRANTSSFNGQLGIHGTRTDRLLVEQNMLMFNNQEHFNAAWEAGGAKVTNASNMRWRDNVVEGNLGSGLWWDISVDYTTIVRNIVRDNEGSGIDYEISAHAVIASNLVVNNAVGINVNESNDIDVYNNTLVRNGMNVRVYEGKRTNDNADERSRIPWDAQNVVIKNNILSNARADSHRLLLVDDYSDTDEPKRGEQIVSALDHNGYYRTKADEPAMLVLWSGGATDRNYETLDAFRTEHGMEQHGVSIDDTSKNPFFRSVREHDYRLKPDSVAQGAGAPLPESVAVAIGVLSGSPVDLGIFSP